MQIGVFIFPTEYSIRIDELARAVEERGFESLFVPEHTHIPVEPAHPLARRRRAARRSTRTRSIRSSALMAAAARDASGSSSAPASAS